MKNNLQFACVCHAIVFIFATESLKGEHPGKDAMLCPGKFESMITDEEIEINNALNCWARQTGRETIIQSVKDAFIAGYNSAFQDTKQWIDSAEGLPFTPNNGDGFD